MEPYMMTAAGGECASGCGWTTSKRGCGSASASAACDGWVVGKADAGRTGKREEGRLVSADVGGRSDTGGDT